MPRHFTRTPLACGPCRRRKTKCDGIRPRCKLCQSRDLQCVWSLPDHDAPAPPSTASSERSHRMTALTPESLRGPTIHVTSQPSLVAADAVPMTQNHPPSDALRACLDLFFKHHFANDFCSFDYRPDFENKCAESTTLACSVMALCGRYLPPDEAQAVLALSPHDVFRHYLQEARRLVKAVSDEPSVTNIQASLILAMAELLSSSGSRHWLFSGMAIRMAEIMRLNKEFHQKHTLKEREIRRRTFWACLLFDRALAYFLAKHHTINNDTISIAVPGTDLSILYQEESRGVTLSSLAAHPRPSDLGLSAYLIKTVSLWSDLADFAAYSRRRLELLPPTDSQSMFHTRTDALRMWVDVLPDSLRWSEQNHASQCSLGQERTYVSMQFLLQSAFCIAHQCYLPHPTLYTRLDDLVDAAGWSYLYREESLVGTCVTHALRAGDMLAYLLATDRAESLQNVWVASAMLTISNVFLWIQHAHDEVYSTPDNCDKASHYFDQILKLVSSWTEVWTVAGQWLVALGVMRDLYKAAYLGEVDDRLIASTDNEAEPGQGHDPLLDDFRPQPGDGFPTLIAMPNLQASIKLATCDVSARSINIPSIWLQLSGGWPYGYAEPGYGINTGSLEPMEHTTNTATCQSGPSV